MTSSSKPLPQRNREDRNAEIQFVFDPVVVESNDVNTAVLLLQSEEDRVVTQVLAALDRFTKQSEEFAHDIHNTELLEILIRLIRRHQLYTKRFASKILAQVSSNLPVKWKLLNEAENFVTLLAKEIDEPMQEYASVVLLELTKLHVGCAQLLTSGITDILFKLICSSDPDVKYNCAQIMANLLRDPMAASEFVKSSAFHFPPILALIQTEFPLIQNTGIEILDLLTRRQQDTIIQDMFRESNGIEELIDILEMDDWKDLHQSLLCILSNVADYFETAEYMSLSGCLRRIIMYTEKVGDEKLNTEAWKIITKMAYTDAGRKVLFDNHGVPNMLSFLKDARPDVLKTMCFGLTQMIKHSGALESLVEENPIQDILSILKSDTMPWDTREVALILTYKFLEADKSLYEAFLSLRGQDTILNLLKQSQNKVPVEMISKLLMFLTFLSFHEDVRREAIETNFTKVILQHLENEDLQIKIMACECLSAYVCEETLQDNIILEGDILPLLTSCLMNPNMQLRKAAACLTQLLTGNEVTAHYFIKNETLNWMLEQKETRKSCPAWETAIETLFKKYLPAKFAYMGHLDMQDVTSSPFYVTRRAGGKFQILEELLENQAVPIDCMYVANLKSTQPDPQPEEKPAKPESVRKSRGSVSVTGKHTSRSKSSSASSKGRRTSNYEALYTPDPYLVEYLEEVRSIIKPYEAIKGTEQNIINQAEVLGEYIAKQMSGPSRTVKFFKLAHEQHIKELQYELETSIIPIGFVRTGLHFERAMLFKVLADQIGLPCAFVRGEYGQAWVEVASPEEPQHEEEDLEHSTLPTCLRPNYVVDLMDNPGRLLPVNSHEAAEYCGLPSAQKPDKWTHEICSNAEINSI